MDIEKLTLGEIAIVEQLSGHTFSDLANDESPKGMILSALAYVIKKRDIPDYTFDQAQKLTMEDINELMSDDEPEKKE